MAPEIAFLTRHLCCGACCCRGGVLAFFVFLVLTFPYDLLARRIEFEAQRAGAE